MADIVSSLSSRTGIDDETVRETDSFIQGVLDGRPFRLRVDGGDALTIKVSVSAGSGSGSSEAVFSTL